MYKERISIYSIPIGTDKRRLAVGKSFIWVVKRNSYVILIDGRLSGWPFSFWIYVGGKFDGKFTSHIWFSSIISLSRIVKISF